MPLERLQKVLARSGFGSRRHCEQLISAGSVEVDGRVITTMGFKVDASRSKIKCDGRYVKQEKRHYFLLNKPKGYICTAQDEKGRRKVVDIFKGVRERLFTIGRLDAGSEGLIIVTNDGELCDRLTHPRYRIPKTYHVVVEGHIPPDTLEKIRKGVWLAEGRTAPAKIFVKKILRQISVAEITVYEGMNREVRRIFAKFGLKVTHLKRIRIGDVELGSTGSGRFRPLDRGEVDGLIKLAR